MVFSSSEHIRETLPKDQVPKIRATFPINQSSICLPFAFNKIHTTAILFRYRILHATLWPVPSLPSLTSASTPSPLCFAIILQRPWTTSTTTTGRSSCRKSSLSTRATDAVRIESAPWLPLCWRSPTLRRSRWGAAIRTVMSWEVHGMQQRATLMLAKATPHLPTPTSFLTS